MGNLPLFKIQTIERMSFQQKKKLSDKKKQLLIHNSFWVGWEIKYKVNSILSIKEYSIMLILIILSDK